MECTSAIKWGSVLVLLSIHLKSNELIEKQFYYNLGTPKNEYI